MQGKCYQCAHLLTEWDYRRNASCPSCKNPTKVCLNCLFFDMEYANQCREPQAEWIVDKKKSNFCEYFKPQNTVRDKSLPQSLREAAEKLFKKDKP